jgi:hypothetical protein
LAVDFLAGAFFAELDFDALDFFAVLDFDALDFFDALDLDALDFFAGDFFAELDFDALDFDALDFFAGDFFAELDFDALDFFAELDLDALDFFAELDFFAGAFDVALFAVDFVVPEDRVAVFFAAPAALRADPVALCATAVAACPAEVLLAASAALRADSMDFWAAGSLGSFFAPETIALRSAPGVNFGTAFFLARMVSPVRGLRTVRALRTCLLKEPKPVMATFSPLATSRVITSSTDSRACWACLRLPSKRVASVSINSVLFTGIPFVNECRPSSPLGACSHARQKWAWSQ